MHICRKKVQENTRKKKNGRFLLEPCSAVKVTFYFGTGKDLVFVESRKPDLWKGGSVTAHLMYEIYSRALCYSQHLTPLDTCVASKADVHSTEQSMFFPSAWKYILQCHSSINIIVRVKLTIDITVHRMHTLLESGNTTYVCGYQSPPNPPALQWPTSEENKYTKLICHCASGCFVLYRIGKG